MIVCCRFDVGVLDQTFAKYPDLSVDVEWLHGSESIPLRLVFWASGVPGTKLDAALAADPTVEDRRRLTSVDDQTLYRTRHAADSPAVTVYNAAIEHDAVLLASSNDGEGWDVRFRIPDRNTLSRFCQHCREFDIEVDVTSIHDRDVTTCAGFGLTDAQRDIIALAWERGYFAVPRETSLSALGAELGVTQQAASERLRRGLSALVSHTVCERRSNMTGTDS
ncbi:MAG: helix-turn-helix domain-containing protein [Halorhabdus sp.]